MDLRDALYEVRGLKAIWDAERFDEYSPMARAFLEKWRGPIRDASHHREPFLRTIRCLEALLVIHNNLATADEDARRADEDLFLDTAPRFRPWTPEQQIKHDFEIPNLTSNIAKRRAFVALRGGRIEEAAVSFEQAVAAAEIAAAVGSTEKIVQGATKHLQYLRFHRAISAMLLAEAKGLPNDAEGWWLDAKNAANHKEAPTDLFTGGYILDREDFDAYVHLIEALRSFLQERFAAAVESYGTWLAAVPHRQGHWRFQNVFARKQLAEICNCVGNNCPRCDACLSATNSLEPFLGKWGLGRAGRELARMGLVIHRVGPTLEIHWLQKILQDGVFPLLPICVSVPESTSPTSGNYAGLLPHYFAGLHSEVRGLKGLGCAETVLRDFIFRRLRDFIEICAEYELGRTAISLGGQAFGALLSGDLVPLVSSLIDARQARKGPLNFGTLRWKQFKDLLSGAEEEQRSSTALETYKVITESMAGYFPAIVRVVARNSRKADNSQTEYTTSVEQLGNDEFEIRSQFPFEGDVGYLPPRYVRERLTQKLLTNDRSKWVPATKAAALFIFQTISVWEGNWTQLKDEFESQFLDFKQEQPQSLAKHLAAFSNSHGGWLVFGVYDAEDRESGEVARGLNLIECTRLIDAIAQAGLTKCEPMIIPNNIFRAYPEGKLVILYRVDRSIMRPHRVNEKIYVRVGATSQPVTEEAWYSMVSLV